MSGSLREAYERVRHYLGLDPDNAYRSDERESAWIGKVAATFGG